jgi:hypothetical protein
MCRQNLHIPLTARRYLTHAPRKKRAQFPSFARLTAGFLPVDFCHGQREALRISENFIQFEIMTPLTSVLLDTIR